MRRLIIVAIGVFVFMALANFGIDYANAQTEEGEAVKEGEVINTFCPVMGGKIDKDTPYKVEYEGQTIGFCCAGCVAAFNAEPEKFMGKLQKKRTIECPVCGAEFEIPAE